MRVTFVGCGDAFGSGGRFNTCFHVETADRCFLMDCGATALVALKRLKLDRNAISTILVTHFHADHFGGVPFFVLDAQFFARRRAPLTIAGPPGLVQWYDRAMETAFPGSAAAARKFDVHLKELMPGTATALDGLGVHPELVRHGQPEGPFFAYRVSAGGKVLAYTGDTEWTDRLVTIGREADLLIAEAYLFDRRVPLHLDLATLETKLEEIRPRRLILTHMSEDVLSRLPLIAHETAEDGMVVSL